MTVHREIKHNTALVKKNYYFLLLYILWQPGVINERSLCIETVEENCIFLPAQLGVELEIENTIVIQAVGQFTQGKSLSEEVDTK